jgi:hypothetical protein
LTTFKTSGGDTDKVEFKGLHFPGTEEVAGAVVLGPPKGCSGIIYMWTVPCFMADHLTVTSKILKRTPEYDSLNFVKAY